MAGKTDKEKKRITDQWWAEMLEAGVKPRRMVSKRTVKMRKPNRRRKRVSRKVKK